MKDFIFFFKRGNGNKIYQLNTTYYLSLDARKEKGCVREERMRELKNWI